MPQLRLDVRGQYAKRGSKGQPLLPLLRRGLVAQRRDDHGHVDVGGEDFVYRRIGPLDLLLNATPPHPEATTRGSAKRNARGNVQASAQGEKDGVA